MLVAVENETAMWVSKANIRKLAVPVPGGRGDIPCGVDVHQSLVLADDLFRYRADLPGRRVGCFVETA